MNAIEKKSVLCYMRLNIYISITNLIRLKLYYKLFKKIKFKTKGPLIHPFLPKLLKITFETF